MKNIMGPLSVCLCLSGQMRSFEQNFAWIAALPESVQLTVVVATWSNRGGKLHGDQKPERLRSILPCAVTDALPPSWLDADLLEQLPGLRQAARQRADGNIVTEAMIRAVLPSAAIHIEPEFRFAWFEQDRLASADPRNSDPYSLQMLYKIWQADMMRRNIERERERPFDVVIRARPDRPLEQLSIEFLRQIRPGELWVQDLYPSRRYIGDMLALGDGEAMRAYANFFHEALRRAEAGEWTYIHTDLYEYLTEKRLTLRGCKLLGPFALDRLLDVSDLLTAIGLAAADLSRPARDPIRAHAPVAASSVRLAERLSRGTASLSEPAVIADIAARLSGFEPARDAGLLHWLAMNAGDAIGPGTRLLCAAIALTALPDPSDPGLAYPLVTSFCIACEAFARAARTHHQTGAETLAACTAAATPDPLQACLAAWLAQTEWQARVADVIDVAYDMLLDQDPGLWLRLAGLVAEAAQPSLAEGILRRALARRPDEPQIPQQLAFLLDSLGRRNEAAGFAAQAMRAAPGNAHILHNASIIFLRAGDVRTAISAAQASVTIEPDNEWFQAHLSAALALACRDNPPAPGCPDQNRHAAGLNGQTGEPTLVSRAARRSTENAEQRPEIS